MAAPSIRVLHVTWSIDPVKGSGPGDALRALASEQARTGLKVSIVTADAPPGIEAIAAPLRQAGIVVHSIGPVRQFLTIGRNARDALRDVLASGVDVVHIHGMWQHLLHSAAVEAHRAGVPYIIRGAGMLDPWAMDHGRLKKRLHLALVSGRDLRQARALHATAYAEARSFAGLGFNTPVAVVAHGIEFADRQPARRDPEADARWPAIKGFRRMLFLGRIDPVKGTIALAEAWGRLAPQFPAWRLVIAGPDWAGHKSELEESLAARHVLDKTVFVGTVRGNDKRILLSSCDLFVQPSLQENFGITIAEALAAGRPVITTKGTPWQVLPVRGAGWWIDHGAAPLEQALREAMSMDQAALDEMGSKGPWIIEERSSWPRVAARLNAVYAWMLEREKAPDFVYLSKTDMPEGWGTGGNGHAIARDRRKPTSMLPPISIPRLSPQASDVVVRYALTIAIVALASLIRWSVSYWVGDRVSLFMAYAATAVVTLLCGVRAGLVALLLGYFVNTLLFVSPRGLLPTNALDAVKVGFYAGAGLVTCALAAWLRRRETQAQEREWAAEDKIAAQAAELARSNAELEQFAQLVAKDLKEPLRGIATNTRRLLEAHAQALSSPARQLAQTMDRQARRGISMVDAVLELSLAGRDLQLAEVDLNSVLDDVIEDLRELIAEERANIVVDRLPAVTCDRVQLLRVLSILIKNAIMYNNSPVKRIEIGTSPRASADRPPTIYVRDNGVGIAPEDRERVFELFSRVHTHPDFGGGSGTGLAMVRSLCKVTAGWSGSSHASARARLFTSRWGAMAATPIERSRRPDLWPNPGFFCPPSVSRENMIPPTKTDKVLAASSRGLEDKGILRPPDLKTVRECTPCQEKLNPPAFVAEFCAICWDLQPHQALPRSSRSRPVDDSSTLPSLRAP